MADSMFLIVIKRTGHVLAAMTELPDGSEPKLEDLCGADFTVGAVRNQATKGLPLSVPLACEQLELRSAPLDLAVLANPRRYVADGPATTPIVAPEPALGAILTAASLGSASFGDKSFVALNAAGAPDEERRLGMAPTSAPFTPIELKTSPAAGVASPISAGGAEYDVLVAISGVPVMVQTLST